jgi:hypothetical protein
LGLDCPEDSLFSDRSTMRSPFAPAEHDGISFIKGTNQGRRAFHVPMKRGEPAARPAGGAGLAGMD